MIDPIVSEHLRNIQFDFNNKSEFTRIMLAMSEPRSLDQPVKQISLKSTIPLRQCSIASLFQSYYNDCVFNANAGQYSLTLPNGTRIISKVSYCVLKSLLYMCTGKDAKLCRASAETFVGIAAAGSGALSDDALYEFVKQPSDNYYASTLRTAILSVAFSNTEALYYWRKVADCGGYYKTAIAAGEEYIRKNNIAKEKDLNKVLQTAYKEAKTDKKWMGQLLKKIPSKQLIGMMWLTYPDNPAVMKPDDEDSGFIYDAGKTKVICAMDLGALIEEYLPERLEDYQSISVDPKIASRVRAELSKGGVDVRRVRESEDWNEGAMHIGLAGDLYVCC